MLLQALKNRFATWVLRIFAVLLIISFGAWGIGDMLRGSGAPTEVAEVGDTLIGVNEFNQAFQREMSRLRSVFGAQFGTDQARQLGLIDVTLQRLIARRLIALEAAELGLEVGKDQIRHRIMAQQEFRNQRGQFDRAIFENAIARNGMNEALYVESLRGEIARGHLIGVINAGGAAPSRLAETLYRYRNEKRTADVVEILRSAQPNVPEPDDAQLSAFHTENAARFTSPERRDATAIHLDPTDLAAEIRPPEESVRDEFENRLAALTVPERRRLRQIVVQDEATARKVSSSLKQGRAFADVAKELAGQAPASTNLGLVTFGDIPPEMADVAFKLGEKQSSQPISTPLGWHVLMVDKIEPGRAPKFEELREQLSKDLARELAVDRLVNVANRLEDALAGGGSLSEAAAQLNVELAHVRSMNQTGQTAAGTKRGELAGNAQFVQTAFETSEGQTSDLMETEEGGYFILRVDRIVPPSLKPLESIRKEVVAAWKRTKRDDSAKRQAEEIFERVKGGAALASIAAEKGLKLRTSKPFTRFNQPAGSPVEPALAADLFRAPRRGAAMSATGKGYAVAQTKEILAADPSIDKTGLGRLQTQLKAAIAGDMLDQFSAALRRNYPVEVNRAAIDQLFNVTGR